MLQDTQTPEHRDWGSGRCRRVTPRCFFLSCNLWSWTRIELMMMMESTRGKVSLPGWWFRRARCFGFRASVQGYLQSPKSVRRRTWRTIGRGTELSTRLPTLKTLRVRSEPSEQLADLLQARKENVENGLEVDGVKMESLKELHFPYHCEREMKNEQGENTLLRLKELVEKVVFKVEMPWWSSICESQFLNVVQPNFLLV